MKKVITVSLQTQQPLLATSFQGDPNSDVSYSYIPGSIIRGAVIRRYMRQDGLSELDLTKEEVKRLFFDANSTCYLNAYLQSNEGKRTLPIPRSWFKEKNTELTDESSLEVYDFSLNREEILESPKFVGEGFWKKERGSINYYTEKRRINIHNQRDRKKGRSTKIKRNLETNRLEGEGEIFRYEAIDSQQTFQAVILCNSEDDAEIIINLLEKSPDIWLGGSQSAGYGRTKITVYPKIDLDDWNEVDISVDDDDRTDREYLTITLLSDLILRDEWGQYAIIPPSTQHQIPAPLTRELEKILGTKIKPKYCFTSNNFVGGFNRKWGLPLPTVPVLAAGSVFVFDFEDSAITSEQIKEIENNGIGERKTEGFGRVVINWLDEELFEMRLPKKNQNTQNSESLTNASQHLAAQMAERLLENKIEQALKQYLGYTSIEGEISNSQMSRLQIIARQALPTGDCSLILSLIEPNEQENENTADKAINQFNKARIGESSLKDKLKYWLNNPDDWIINKQNLKVNIAGVERNINDEFAQKNKLVEKYTLRLIMALAKKATKEKNK
ncbi:MAG: CRISPR-associated RAMP protein Csx10 [Rivularia sp. (in: cyanobacteria)]